MQETAAIGSTASDFRAHPTMANASSDPIAAEAGEILWASLAPRPSLRADSITAPNGSVLQRQRTCAVSMYAGNRFHGIAVSNAQRASSERQIASVPKLPMRLSCMMSSMRSHGPAAAERVGGIGQPIFVKASRDHDEVGEHRERDDGCRQMRVQQAFDSDRADRDQHSHQGIELGAAEHEVGLVTERRHRNTRHELHGRREFP